MQGIQIGQLLIQQGVLSAQQVEHILELQKTSNRPFGDLAERVYDIHPKAAEDAWVEQYVRLAGIIDLNTQQVDRKCLHLINPRQAWQFHVLPLGRWQDNLQMATSSQDLVRAVNFSANKLHEPVHFVLAKREQLRDFLMKYYPVPSHIAQYAETMV